MREMLDREAKDGDLIIKPRPKYGYTVLQIGVKKGQSLWYLDYGTLRHCTLGEYYLIENPNEQELKIKNEILKAMNGK